MFMTRGMGALIQVDSNDLMIPVLIPQTTTPAVTGINSNWLIAGAVAVALLASWGIFGVVKEKKKQAAAKGVRFFKKKAVRAAKK